MVAGRGGEEGVGGVNQRLAVSDQQSAKSYKPRANRFSRSLGKQLHSLRISLQRKHRLLSPETLPPPNDLPPP